MAGYSTDPSYADKLIGIMKQYKLDQYDTVAFVERYSTSDV